MKLFMIAAAMALPALAVAAPMSRRDGTGITCTKKYEGVLNAVRLGSGYGATAGSPNDTIALADNAQKTLTTDADTVKANPVRFQFVSTVQWRKEGGGVYCGGRWQKHLSPGLTGFRAPPLLQDLCTSDGWNDANGSREYGQIKPVPLAGDVQCVTAGSAAVPGQSDDTLVALYVAACASRNDDKLRELERQWFHARYSSGEQTYVELSLTGNPNDSDYDGDKSSVVTIDDDSTGIKKTVAVERLSSPVPLSLALYDVQVVS